MCNHRVKLLDRSVEGFSKNQGSRSPNCAGKLLEVEEDSRSVDEHPKIAAPIKGSRRTQKGQDAPSVQEEAPLGLLVAWKKEILSQEVEGMVETHGVATRVEKVPWEGAQGMGHLRGLCGCAKVN
ncbi:hypothetical protein GOBAR_AA30889 [Gossypium barbadense]|uniref:Uncharacterized protein n=1 Tax=Gossypium barbadense TaxID=3634 RepID=A0A2P5WFC1_GOSBA|nr:hypothetical protein GOBAR_AA30889 [Gossypium barbadense]